MRPRRLFSKALSAANELLNPLGYRVVKTKNRKHDLVVNLPAVGSYRGDVLLSYIIDPFLVSDSTDISLHHTHDWESWRMAHSFAERGFSVDIIHFHNTSFAPEKNYRVFVGARTNFERIARLLNPECVKVAHLDTCHWLFNNQAAYRRLAELMARRQISLSNPKMVEENWAIESADLACVLGNEFTAQSYRFAGKPIHFIPISAPMSYPWDDEKDFETCKRGFIWFGSSGFVHKGLDTVLEAFAKLPECRLYVCGPLDSEPRFCDAYHTELFESPNIEAVGWVDVSSDRFREISRRCSGLVYPTCAEGGGGSVITCMHMGIVPLVTAASSVNLDGFGKMLESDSVASVANSVRDFAARPATEIEREARRSWNYAREHHTRERFAQNYDAFVDNLLENDGVVDRLGDRTS